MTEKEVKKKLTLKQIKFCEEYVLLKNATKAALNAGYSENSAYAIGCENLKKLEIKEYIAKLRKEVEDNFYYSFVDSFKKLEEAQELALKTVKKAYHEGSVIDVTPAPDLGAFIKAEELKGKLFDLYQPENRTEVVVNCMGNVKVGGTDLELKIGKPPATEEE